MLKKLSRAAMILAVFALGFAAGGYFMADGQQFAVSEAQAGACAKAIAQAAETITHMPDYATCSYRLRFDKKPVHAGFVGNQVLILFK